MDREMVGRTILHYKITEQVGQGGMGVVYKAEDTRLGRVVAVKFLPHQIADRIEKRERFKIEARAAAAINHPNVTTIHAIEEAEGKILIVMEFITGRRLRDLLPAVEGRWAGRPLDLSDALKYAGQIAAGLKAAHEKGVVHRDIKPENIMVNAAGQVKIMDFGLAKMEDSGAVTVTGSAMGTLAYMSPEQVRGEPLDLRTDIWSWGVTCYEMIAGRHPFEGTTYAAIVSAILNDSPPPLTSFRPDVSERLDGIVRRALAKDRPSRYSDCTQILDDLKSLTQSAVRTATPHGRGDAVEVVGGRGKVEESLERTGAHRGARVLGKKIVVLPFINISGDAGYEYFSDGVTEDILTELVKIGDLRVISRTTAMLYKGSQKTIREIGRELGVSVVLEGSVRRGADRVRIAAQLIDAETDEHLWAETYDRNLTEALSIQSEIAQEIAGALQTRLSPSERRRLRATRVSDPAVYNLLLQGRYLYARGSREDVALAIENYLQALAIDPQDARAWSLLAGAYARQGDTGALSPEDAYRKAREATEKALSLDDDLAIAHVMMAWIKRSYDWDWVGAEAELRKAMRIAPGDFVVIRNMAKLAWTLGRSEEAIGLARQACDIDPLRVANYTMLGFNLMYAGHLDEARASFQRAIELDPKYPTVRTFLGLTYLLQGDTDRAIAEICNESDEGWRLYGLAQAHHAASHAAEAEAALNDLIARYQNESAYQVAQVYAYRGDVDHAFEWLERAYAMRDGGLTEMKGDPFLKGLESDPRYAVFMRKMRLQD